MRSNLVTGVCKCATGSDGRREIIWTHTSPFRIRSCKQTGVNACLFLIRKKGGWGGGSFNNLFREVHTLQIQARYHTRGNEKMLRFERTSPLFPLLDTFHVFSPALRLKDMPSEIQTHAWVAHAHRQIRYVLDPDTYGVGGRAGERERQGGGGRERERSSYLEP